LTSSSSKIPALLGLKSVSKVTTKPKKKVTPSVGGVRHGGPLRLRSSTSSRISEGRQV